MGISYVALIVIGSIVLISQLVLAFLVPFYVYGMHNRLKQIEKNVATIAQNSYLLAKTIKPQTRSPSKPS